VRVGVVSDLHADGDALDRLWAGMERESVDSVWCLGDFCCGGPDVVRCFDEVVARCEVVLAGNHERFVVQRGFESSRGNWGEPARRAHAELGSDRRRVLARLPSEGVARGVFAVHGRPGAPVYGFILSPADASAAIARAERRLVLYGHTHEPAWWEHIDDRAHRREIPLGAAAQVARGALLNPGAACDPRGVRWLALDLPDAPEGDFAVTFHLEPRLG
jgi:predicted phosphodiesterase